MKSLLLELLFFVVSAILIKFNRFIGGAALVLFAVYLSLKYKPYYYTFKANKSYNKGKREEALEFYEKASKCKNCAVGIKTMYGFLLLKMGHLDESDKILSNIIESKNTSIKDKWSAKISYAFVLWKKGEVDKGIEILDKVYEEHRNVSVYESLGLLLVEKGDMERALKINEEAYDYDKENPVILDNLGQTYLRMGENDKALEKYKILYEKSPKFPEAYYNYGIALLKKGENKEAIEIMKKSLLYNFSFISTVSKETVENKLAEYENI